MEMSNAMLAAGMLFSVSLILASLVRVCRMDVVKDVICQDKSATIVAFEIRGYGYRVRRDD